MDTAFQSIRDKLYSLWSGDRWRKLFGSDHHIYVMNPVATGEQIAAFEAKHRIMLPKGYRDFMQIAGNGGAGPYYGLLPLEHALRSDVDTCEPDNQIDPSQPFPFTKAWNMDRRHEQGDDEAYDTRFEEEYFDNKWATGLLRISNFGCGVSINIVVNGPEYGHIWVDDRCNEGGIYPDHYFGNEARVDFLTWYNLWLDQALAQLRK